MRGSMKSGSIVVVACMIGLMFSTSPMFFSTFGLFIKPLASELGWGRAQLASAVSIAALTSALVTPFFGRMIDAHGSRRVILISTIALSAVVASLSFLPKVYLVYVIMSALIGIAGTGSTTFAYLSILPAWFTKKLGMSLAFATVGFGLGQALAPLFANWLIREFGWRLAYAALGLSVFAVAVPNALFLLKDRPTGGTAEKRLMATDLPGISHREALRKPVFWRLMTSFCLITIAVTGCTVHIVPLLTDRGLSSTSAASALTIIGAAMVVTRFAAGALLDYVGARLLGVLTFGGCALGIALILSGMPGASVLLGVTLLGVGLGIEATLMPYITRRVFGMRSYGTIYGYVFTAFNVGVVLGPLVMGLLFDRSGSYTLGLEVLLTLAVISALLLLPKLSYDASEAFYATHIDARRVPG